MEDEKPSIKPPSLILDNLKLEPYQYQEHAYGDSLTIEARVNISKAEYIAIGKLPHSVKVVRGGVDEEPRLMNLIEIAYSESDDRIKEEIHLLNTKPKKTLPMVVWLGNSSKATIEQGIVINELLSTLVSNGIIREDDVTQMKSKITEESIREKQRSLNRLKVDIDEFEFR